ncbi:WXG100 family type VII secretion target [Oscillochloris sp. ZM17-4]|uniref:WXG100 family type VII secretion target n=1 Tax=Oscillochloris sp. ZM17-4 TaxID=2866714 RepID=UPI001C739012|nr:WXG100 family type VII secretion target [Oscillochloris sp. ZM17-4]MBX0329900.1 WXG100 family type VII secretion target [Oscillochloris sp. ZM17-4]
MNGDIKVVYADCEAMVAAFKEGTEHLQDVMTELQSIANTMSDGALLGQAGTTYVELIRNQMSPSLTRLTEKFTELAGDVQKAIDLQRAADESVAGSMG